MGNDSFEASLLLYVLVDTLEEITQREMDGLPPDAALVAIANDAAVGFHEITGEDPYAAAADQWTQEREFSEIRAQRDMLRLSDPTPPSLSCLYTDHR